MLWTPVTVRNGAGTEQSTRAGVPAECSFRDVNTVARPQIDQREPFTGTDFGDFVDGAIDIEQHEAGFIKGPDDMGVDQFVIERAPSHRASFRASCHLPECAAHGAGNPRRKRCAARKRRNQSKDGLVR